MKLFFGIVLFLFIVIPFFAFSLKFLLTDPPIFPDESYFYTTVLSLRTNGYLSTALYGDSAPGSPEIRSYAYPPLYFYVLRLWTMVQGDTIASIRLVSLIISIATLGVFYLLLVKLSRNLLMSTFGTALLFLSAPYGMASRIGRMEILVVLFFVMTLWFWTLFRADGKRRSVILAGASAGFAVITHPLGTMVPFLLLILILLEKYSKKECSGVGIGWHSRNHIITFWIYTIGDRLDLFTTQFGVGLFYKVERSSLLLTLIRSDGIWACLMALYSLSAISGLIFALKTKNRLVAGLSLGSLVVFFIVTITVEQWYFVYLPIVPIMLFIYFLSFAAKIRNLPFFVSSLITLANWIPSDQHNVE